jgi:hypothetical protein
MDGEWALWETQRVYFPEAVGVLDLYHVLERFWSARTASTARGATRPSGSSRTAFVACWRAG